MRDNDKTGIIMFEDVVTKQYSFASVQRDLRVNLQNVYNGGDTKFCPALEEALAMFSLADLNDSTNNKRIILFSDGIDNNKQRTRTFLSNLYNTHNPDPRNKVKIFTVALGNNADKAFLEEIANMTGGVPYVAQNAAELGNIYTQIGAGIDFDPTDNDIDGLPDILEIVGVRCANGQVIHSDPTLDDSDGDGLKDGQEVLKDSLRVMTAYSYHENGRPICFTMKSDPNKADSDMDSFIDSDDPNPFYPDKKYVASLNQKDYLRIRYTDSNGWTSNSISSDPSISYGSAQTWFLNPSYTNSYYDSGRLTGAEVDAHGCGLIAACDTLFYLAAFHPEANLNALQNQIAFNSIDQTFSYTDSVTRRQLW